MWRAWGRDKTRHSRRRSFYLAWGWRLFALLALCAGHSIEAQPAATPSVLPPLPLKQAAAATELPLGAWGPYSRRHIGPCYLANRLPVQLFAFPIVLGQKRAEAVFDPKSKSVLPQNVSIQRRAMGLSPIQAAKDDAFDPAGSSLRNHRVARIIEADADGILWKTQIAFAPAPLAQRVAPSFDANGAPQKPAPWSEGLATVEAFPAFTDAETDGLLLRVTLENRSDAPQTYFVDLLGGLDILAPDFTAADLTVQADGSSATLHHAKSDAYFALAAHTPYPARAYRVRDAYFSQDAAVTPRDPQGHTLPFGALAPDAPHPAAASPDSGVWGLTRVDDITLDPRQTVTLWLSVGIGKDADTAQRSARALLLLAEDANAPGKPRREGAYSKALAAHNAARYASGDPALDHLMAQSLANTPYATWRRVGVPSRAETNNSPGGMYQPEAGGYIALGWVLYRPDVAAAQLNAFFQTGVAADKPSPEPAAVRPSNFVALWELFQQTHDRTMLTAFYPAARRRYLELRDLMRDPKDLTRTSDVLRTARILRAFAQRLERTLGEIADYDRDIEEATHMLPDGKLLSGILPDARQPQFGASYLQWQDLLDVGQTDQAARMAPSLLERYRNLDPGSDLTGEACALIPLFAAYHNRGVVTAGFDIALWDTHYEPERDTLHVVFRPRDASGKAALLCVMGHPNADYTITGAIAKTLRSDANGILTLTAPADPTTQQLDIAPAGKLP